MVGFGEREEGLDDFGLIERMVMVVFERRRRVRRENRFGGGKE